MLSVVFRLRWLQIWRDNKWRGYFLLLPTSVWLLSSTAQRQHWQGHNPSPDNHERALSSLWSLSGFKPLTSTFQFVVGNFWRHPALRDLDLRQMAIARTFLWVWIPFFFASNLVASVTPLTNSSKMHVLLLWETEGFLKCFRTYWMMTIVIALMLTALFFFFE